MSGNSSAIQAIKVSSDSVATISANIANSGSNGYKEVKDVFHTLVDQGSAYGVVAKKIQNVSGTGAINNTGNSTDLAISGEGFFVVNRGDSIYYTRNGDFSLNNDLLLTNSENVTLKVWEYSDNGEYVPSPDELIDASFTDLGVEALPTTQISMDINLKADQDIVTGYGSILDYSTNDNKGIERSDIIIPDSTISTGDGLTITTEASDTTEVYYGGISVSKKIDEPLTGGILGSVDEKSTFSKAVTGDNFIISTIGSGETVFTFNAKSPDTSRNEFNNLGTLAQAIDRNEGMTARINKGQLYVSLINANDSITFKNNPAGLYKTGELNGAYGQDTPKTSVLSFPASSLTIADENDDLGFSTGSSINITLK